MSNPVTAPPIEIELIVRAEHADPFHILGAHPVTQDGRPAVAVRAFQPGAAVVELLDLERPGAPVPLARVHPDGLFEGVLPARTLPFRYRLRVTDATGWIQEFHDPYALPPVLSDFDLHLLGEGTHLRRYEWLGAHLRTHDGLAGVLFAVWAPTATRVSVVGDFNAWDGRRHPMRSRGESGIWELFIPGLGAGELYKFEIRSPHVPYPFSKADPHGFAFERPPNTASLVYDIGGYPWGDGAWMAGRARANALDAPLSVYEVHLGSWRRVPEEGHRYLTYAELAQTLIPYAQEMGFTHLELLPVMEHPFDASWGYQTVGYFAPTSRHGTPTDFMAFVDRCHQAGLGVILDWVPGHFPSDPHGLGWFDGTGLYHHADPRQGVHRDWDTLIFNYGRPEVRNYLLSNALFWLERYHADGLRVDAVASMLYLDYSRPAGEWIPNKHGGRENLEAIEFLKQFNIVVHQQHPGVLTIAEESTAWPAVSRPVYLGGLGFDLKWNMGWMHDTLVFMSKGPVHRKYHFNNLTFSLLYAFTENFLLPLSHDEVVHGKAALLAKMPGDAWQQFATLRLLYGLLFAHPGKKLLFMGGEFGQWREWTHDESLEWHLLGWEAHQGIQQFVRDLNGLYRRERALHEVDFDWRGFEWIDFRDADGSVVAFLRRAKDPAEAVVCVFNFTPVPRPGYRIGVPSAGWYRELLNSDARIYGGGDIGNAGGVLAEPVPWQGQPCSVPLILPPLGLLALKRA